MIYFQTVSGNHTQDYNYMNFLKKIAINFFMVAFLGAISSIAFAEVATENSTSSITTTIAHVEQGLVEVQKSDFAAANLHLKAAVESSAQIEGNDAVVKEASANVVQGNIQSKQGEVAKSSEFLNKALALYKSI
jgi:hypothetical protein